MTTRHVPTTLSGALHLDGSRPSWERLADTLLLSLRVHASPGHARITPPGSPGGYGRDVDGLEGFARSFILAAFRLAGDGGRDPHGLAEWYARGIEAGTDPDAADRWVRLTEHPQAKVEAASIALGLDLTREWIWDRLDAGVQRRLVEYLAAAVGDDTYPRINWVWFRLVVQTFLRSVDGPHSLPEMAEDLATHDSFARADGWLADGSERAYDHYVGWALHLYPTLWAHMAGAKDLAAPRREADRAALDRYLVDAVTLVGADGSPLIQGRSLIYRFAAAAPFWIGAMAEVPSVSPGVLRRAATAVVSHFVDRDAPDADGLLTLGWHDAWPPLAQSYSGPASPYWASKGLLGLALPADHPVWTTPLEPLPVESGDVLRVIQAPGWIVSGTADDGIVRVINHGTDHSVEQGPPVERGRATQRDHAEHSHGVGDSPLYARLGYSTATSPLLDEASWREPADQSVVLVDAQGRASHRTGMRLLGVTAEHGVAVGVSEMSAHWLSPHEAQPHHGSGYAGTAAPAGSLTVVSVVRGPWEVRLVRLWDDVAEHGAQRLRILGWPLADGQEPGHIDDGVTTTRLTSAIVAVAGHAGTGTVRRADASPLGVHAAVPYIELPARPGWGAATVALTGRSADDAVKPCVVDLTGANHEITGITVTWPDGVHHSLRLAVREPGATSRFPVAIEAQGRATT